MVDFAAQVVSLTYPKIENFYSPSIFWENGVYKMWTTVADRVEYFESANGTTWTGGRTVFSADPNSWENDGGSFGGYTTGISDPRVVRDATPGRNYTMYYTAGTAPNSTIRGGIGAVVSNDGLNWTRLLHDPLRVAPGGFTFILQAITVNDVRYVYYLSGGSQAATIPPTMHVMQDTGDGLHFTNDHEVTGTLAHAYPLAYDAATKTCWMVENYGSGSFTLYRNSDGVTRLGDKVIEIGAATTGRQMNFDPMIIQRDGTGQWIGATGGVEVVWTQGALNDWQPISANIVPLATPAHYVPASVNAYAISPEADGTFRVVAWTTGETVSGARDGDALQFNDGVAVLDSTGAAGTIDRLYHAALGREADAGGLAGWTTTAATVPLGDIATAFVQSPEFIAHNGSDLSNAAFVTAMYRNMFDREADAGGQAAWTQALNNGVTRGSLALTFANSAEGLAHVPNAGDADSAFVYRMYETALNRAPDAGGAAAWTSVVKSGASAQQIADAFVGSNEFAHAYGTLTPRDFVAALYTNVLGRMADADGLQAWTDIMSNIGRSGVVLGFANSKEFRIHTAPATHDGYVFLPN